GALMLEEDLYNSYFKLPYLSPFKTVPFQRMSASRVNCLLVLSSSSEGVSSESFRQAYNLASSNFNIQVASPNGKNIEFIQQDDNNRRWFNEFRSKSVSTPIGLETIDPNRYSALLIPAAPGALHDLTNNEDLAVIIRHFVKEKKSICAIGLGVAALFCAKEENKQWSFEDYSLTGPSVYELAKSPDFSSLPLITEDTIKDLGGKYN
ncbi:Hypothetical predicted protein, partial [Mytilus galloprovincialis]